MLSCKSCTSCFQRVDGLVDHIQSSCLAFYKEHPEYWFEILTKMAASSESSMESQSPGIPSTTGIEHCDVAALTECNPQMVQVTPSSTVNDAAALTERNTQTVQVTSSSTVSDAAALTEGNPPTVQVTSSSTVSDDAALAEQNTPTVQVTSSSTVSDVASLTEQNPQMIQVTSSSTVNDAAALTERNRSTLQMAPNSKVSDAAALTERNRSTLQMAPSSRVSELTSATDTPFFITFKPQQIRAGEKVRNLHMTAEEYFYGHLIGSGIKLKQNSRNCKCDDCGKSLRNNVRFMSHMRHKVLNRWEAKEINELRKICKHCYREYDSPFLLHCHLQEVHGALPASCTCRICELDFLSERAFLFHMRNTHVQNEAPYVCKVCNYRSSFYTDVTKHFRDEHSDTSTLMCPFCLALFYTSNLFLKHVLQHQAKGTACARCRLCFISDKEQSSHLHTDHGSQLIEEKSQKFKNLCYRWVYVTVSPLRNNWSEPNNLNLGLKRTFRESLSADDELMSSAHLTKVLKTPTIEIPPYLLALKHSNKVRKLSSHCLNRRTLSNMKCVECGESIKSNPRSLRTHFEFTHECRWCIHMTSCEKASQNHVLREHADSELREQLLGKDETDSASSPAILDDDDDIGLFKINEEHSAELLPITSQADEIIEAMVGDEASPVANLLSDDQGKPISPGTSHSTTNTNKHAQKRSNLMKSKDLQVNTSAKKARKEKQVQTKMIDREKAVQTSDHDFLKMKIKDGDKSSNRKSRVHGNWPLLAPDFFPDIDDDEGWSNYFGNEEGGMQLEGKLKDYLSNPSNWALPTMVPQHSTLEMLDEGLSSQSSVTASVGMASKCTKRGGSYCCIPGCGYSSVYGGKLFLIPNVDGCRRGVKTKDWAEKFHQAVLRYRNDPAFKKRLLEGKAYICYKHFKQTDIIQTCYMSTLKLGSLPTFNLSSIHHQSGANNEEDTEGVGLSDDDASSKCREDILNSSFPVITDKNSQLQLELQECGQMVSDSIASLINSLSRTKSDDILQEWRSVQSNGHAIKSSEVRRCYPPSVIRHCLMLYAKLPSEYRLAHNILVLPSDKILHDEEDEVLNHYQVRIQDGVISQISSAVKSSRNCYDQFAVLCIDEVTIKDDLAYQSSTSEIIGFVEYDDDDLNCSSVTTEYMSSRILAVLVRGVTNKMLDGLVAFYSTPCATAEDLTMLLNTLLVEIPLRTSVIIVGMVFNGLQTNQAVLKIMCQQENGSLKYRMKNPIDPSRYIYFIPYPQQLLRKTRNNWRNQDKSKWADGRSIMEPINELNTKDVTNEDPRYFPHSTEGHVSLLPQEKMKIDAPTLSSTLGSALTDSRPALTKFLHAMDKWLDSMNAGFDQREKMKDRRRPFYSAQDDRLRWLEYDFPTCLDEWRTHAYSRSVPDDVKRSLMLLSTPTEEGLRVVTMSMVAIIKECLILGAECVLPRRIHQGALCDCPNEIVARDTENGSPAL